MGMGNIEARAPPERPVCIPVAQAPGAKVCMCSPGEAKPATQDRRINVGQLTATKLRVNLMLDTELSAWVDDLARELETTTGAELSRSEIVRTARTMLRELHPTRPERRHSQCSRCARRPRI